MICKVSKDVLHIDHCHSSGKVRGLLCLKCNAFIGLAKENINTLVSAIEYLKEANDTTIP